MDFPGRLLAGMMVIVLLAYFPMQYIAQSYNENLDILVDDRTQALTDEIRDKGYLNISMYEEYMAFLDATGELYDFEIKDIHPVTGEEITINKSTYLDLTRNELQMGHEDNCIGGNHLHENESGITNISLKNEKNRESSFISLNDRITMIQEEDEGKKFLAPSHVHTADCYEGHRHTSACKLQSSSNSIFPKQPVAPTYWATVVRSTNGEIRVFIFCTAYNHESGIIWITNDQLMIMPKHYLRSNTSGNGSIGSYYEKTVMKYICTSSGSTGVINPEWDKYLNLIYGLHPYVTGWDLPTQSYKFTLTKEQLEAVGYDTIHGCPQCISYDLSYDKIISKPFYQQCYSYYDTYGRINYTSLIEDETPECNKVVTSIVASQPTQTVNYGESINTTAIATYLDGHTDTVNCTSNFNPNVYGVQNVTLTYTGLVGNARTYGTRTCEVSVTVLNPVKLTSIAVAPASQMIQRYKNPSFSVRAYYDNGTNKLVTGYTITGFNSNAIGTQTVNISYSENGITKAASVVVTVAPMQKECPRCHTVYDLRTDDSDPGCPVCKQSVVRIEATPEYVEVQKGDVLPVIVRAFYLDGSSAIVYDWISDYNTSITGLQIVTIEYGGSATTVTVWVNEGKITCPICGSEYSETEGKCPVCAENVISISVTPDVVTVYQYDPIVLNVVAYYADGSRSLVDEWSIDCTTETVGEFVALVSYKNASANITLKVLSLSTIQCPLCGLLYDPGEYPIGCPVCSTLLVGIEAYLTSGSNLVQYGTFPDVAVVLVFFDAHKELTTEGYTIENYDPHKLGIQTITVYYKEFSAAINIELVNTLLSIVCPNGHVYYFNDDGTDPGCPYCSMVDAVGTVYFFDITYNSEILEKMYLEGQYIFERHNYITVIVSKKNKSLISNMQKTFFKTTLLGRKKKFTYGGEVI